MAAGGSESGAVLTALEEPDAVLRSDMYLLLKRYIVSGGQPEQAVQLLSDGFKGQAHMAQLCCKWLTLLGEVGKSEAFYVRNLVVNHFTPEKADTVFNDGVSKGKAPSDASAILQPTDERYCYHRIALLLVLMPSTTLVLTFGCITHVVGFVL